MKRCPHVSNGMCLSCLSKQDETPTEVKCHHGPHEQCINCMNRDIKKVKQIEMAKRKVGDQSKKIGPIQQKVYTINGGRKEKPTTHVTGGVFRLGDGEPVKGTITASKSKPVAWLCNHPPGMKCSNCICPDGAEDVKRRCNHGPSVRCPNCLPTVEKKQTTRPQIYFSSRCPNHGPNGCCSLCLEKQNYERIRIEAKQIEPVCKKCKFNQMEVDNFRRYIIERNYFVNRYGIMYGKFTDNSVTVEAIFEPEQIINDQNEFELRNEGQMKNVDELCLLLGLEKVGVIFSYKQRKEILTTKELIEAAKRQINWDKRAITATLNPTDNSIECFQASSALVELVQKDLVQPKQPETNMIHLKDTIYVEMKEKDRVESMLFICNVATAGLKKKVFFPRPEFPIENRADREITLIDFKNHFNKYKANPIYEQLLDFHLLVFCIEFAMFGSLERLRECLLYKVEKSEIQSDIKMWLEIDM